MALFTICCGGDPLTALFFPSISWTRTVPLSNRHSLSQCVENRVAVQVGYLSADLYTHSVSYFAEAPLLHHDAASVRLIVYSCVAKVLTSAIFLSLALVLSVYLGRVVPCRRKQSASELCNTFSVTESVCVRSAGRVFHLVIML